MELIAQAMVKLILHLRIGDNDARRPDAEQHVQAVLAVTPEPRIDDPCLCRGRVGTRRSSWPTGATSRVPGKNYEAPVRTPGSTSSNTWRWTDVDTSSFDASWTSTRSGSVGAEPHQRTALTTVAGASWRRIEGALVAIGYAVLRMKYAA